MKRLFAVLSVALLAVTLSVLLVSCSECEHESDRDNNGICDECGEILNEVTKDVWDSEFDITNAAVTILETTESSGNTEGVKQELSVVSGKVYPDSGDESSPSWGMDFSALQPYFAFGASFESFVYDEKTAKYTCDEITVNEITYENVSVTFNTSKRLSSIDYSVQSSERINVSIKILNHGGAAVPEKQ